MLGTVSVNCLMCWCSGCLTPDVVASNCLGLTIRSVPVAFFILVARARWARSSMGRAAVTRNGPARLWLATNKLFE